MMKAGWPLAQRAKVALIKQEVYQIIPCLFCVSSLSPVCYVNSYHWNSVTRVAWICTFWSFHLIPPTSLLLLNSNSPSAATQMFVCKRRIIFCFLGFTSRSSRTPFTFLCCSVLCVGYARTSCTRAPFMSYIVCVSLSCCIHFMTSLYCVVVLLFFLFTVPGFWLYTPHSPLAQFWRHMLYCMCVQRLLHVSFLLDCSGQFYICNPLLSFLIEGVWIMIALVTCALLSAITLFPICTVPTILVLKPNRVESATHTWCKANLGFGHPECHVRLLGAPHEIFEIPHGISGALGSTQEFQTTPPNHLQAQVCNSWAFKTPSRLS